MDHNQLIKWLLLEEVDDDGIHFQFLVSPKSKLSPNLLFKTRREEGCHQILINRLTIFVKMRRNLKKVICLNRWSI